MNDGTNHPTQGPYNRAMTITNRRAGGLALLGLLGLLAGCDSRPTGTPTTLSALVKTRLNVRARAAVAATRGRAALPPGVDVELDFEDVGAMDQSGMRC